MEEPSIADFEQEKLSAAAWAVGEVVDGMLVGLGTGSTASHAITLLGKRVRDGLSIRATPTSSATEDLARAAGIPLVPNAQVSSVDLTIDGADQIDRGFRAIKGGGGALFREKIIAAASRRTIVAVDSRKMVPTLSQRLVPVEVLPAASAFVRAQLLTLCEDVKLRQHGDHAFLTDQRNYVFDAVLHSIADPADVAAKLSAIPGLIEHGLFLTEIDVIAVGRGPEAEVLERNRVESAAGQLRL